MTVELTFRLYNDKVALHRFCRSFGVDPDLVHHDRDIRKMFPDTPVTLLKEVFEALNLYDFAEVLEKATKRRRTLRPALSRKEMEKLANANRPKKVYSEVEVLIIDFCEASENATDNDAARAESFFKALNSRNEVTTLTTDSLKALFVELIELANRVGVENIVDRREERREKTLQRRLENKIPDSWCKEEDRKWKRVNEIELMGLFTGYQNEVEAERAVRQQEQRFFSLLNTDEELLSAFYKEEPAMRNELKELRQKRTQRKNKTRPMLENHIKQKKEELKRETEKFEMAISTVIDEWTELHPNDKGSISYQL